MPNDQQANLEETLRQHGIAIHRCPDCGEIVIAASGNPEQSDRGMAAALETAAELGYRTEIGPHPDHDPDEDPDISAWTMKLTRP